MSKSLFEIFEEYFYPQINIKGDDINADIERYETCHSLLLDLLNDLSRMEDQTENGYRLPKYWEDKLDEYFNRCIGEYIGRSDEEDFLTDENADKYIPYKYTHCSLCGQRCYYNRYPQAFEDDEKCFCEFCLKKMSSEDGYGDRYDDEPKEPKKVRITRK